MFGPLDLSARNTLEVPSEAETAVVVADTPGLREALAALPPADRARARVVGELSNTVLGSEVDVPLLVYRDGTEIDIDDRPDRPLVRAAGNCSLDAVVAAACERGWFGVELLSGIPGTIGAGLVQNVGAYGQEIAPVVTAVEVVERTTGELRTLEPEAMAFGYRTSLLKGDETPPFDVTAVTLRLARRPLADLRYGDVTRQHARLGRDPGDAAARRASVLEVRDGKGFVVGGPHWTPCNGSTFVKPFVRPDQARRVATEARGSRLADWVEENPGEAYLPPGLALRAAGFMNGDRWGPVGLGELHVLAICNYGGATGEQVWALGEHLQAAVNARLGLTLDYEVEFLGRPPAREAAAILEGLPFSAGRGEPDWVSET